MFSNYQIKFADFYKILLGNVKKLVPDFLDEEKYVLHYENLQLVINKKDDLKWTLKPSHMSTKYFAMI